MAAEVGHVFLARLGKKRLRPGGRAITDWLMAHSGLKDGAHVLEVACNQGTTICELAQKWNIKATGLDLDGEALEKARAKVKSLGLSDRVTLVQGNALSLPFPDNSFDLVVNEAMLTMLGADSKAGALKEYYRVLKPGGRLLTHDVMTLEENPQLGRELGRDINASVWPLSLEGWTGVFKTAGFSQVEPKVVPMSLMTPKGMIYDEGLADAIRIFWRGLTRSENREFFLRMKGFFGKHRQELRAIGVVSQK